MTEKLRPLHDNIIARRVKTTSPAGILLPDQYADESDIGFQKEIPIEWEILATGPGKVLEDGSLRALEVKAGDHALAGKYSGVEMEFAGEKIRIMRAQQILAVNSGDGWRPVADHLFVRFLPRQDSQIIHVVTEKRMYKAVVTAIGSGRDMGYQVVFEKNRKATEYHKNKPIRPIDLSLGDMVNVGETPLKFPVFTDGGIKYWILQESDVGFVETNPTTTSRSACHAT